MASTTPPASLPAFGSYLPSDSYVLDPARPDTPADFAEPLGCSLEELVTREAARDTGFVAALIRAYTAQACALQLVLQSSRLGAVDLPPSLAAQLEAARRDRPAFLSGGDGRATI